MTHRHYLQDTQRQIDILLKDKYSIYLALVRVGIFFENCA